MRYCDKDFVKEGVANTETIDCGVMGTFENPLRSDCEEKDQLLIINGVCSREKIENFLAGGDIRRWTELVIPEVLCIPKIKPDVEKLVSISSVVEIISQRVINTPSQTTSPEICPPVFNQEGTAITGIKLVIEGVLRQKIIYSAAQTQSVHAIYFDMPFSAFIVLDPKDSMAQKFKVDICIEDIFVTATMPRKIFKNVILMIRALPLVC
ncbi:MAG: DUF3794 domain-containing protein [Sporomusaceae bacterium]|nr:DUF3794 domain-containing protein [Sporomusaceae bacterium]